jgi:hypothetical protein
MRKFQDVQSVAQRLDTTGDGRGLARIIAEARRLGALESRVAEALGDPLRRHLRLARVEAGTVHLIADSPAWGARARYEAPRRLRSLGWAFGVQGPPRVRVRSRPAQPPVPASPREPARISPATSRFLEGVASGLPEGPLRERLHRLASRCARPRGTGEGS